jgi:hypothetical protein
MEVQFKIEPECTITALVVGFVIAIVCLLTGCNSNPDFSGTYVNSAGSEFSVASDTLVLERAEGNDYLIHRRTGFQLLDAQGKPGKRQFESEEWKAVYDPESKVMTEQRRGKPISFSADGKQMTVVRRVYQRVN